MINVGIIGCGAIASRRHAPEYSQNTNCKLVGFFDADFNRANELALAYNAKAYETLDELIADKNIDAVSVCTSNATHAEIAIKASNAKKHVLCEKPMATKCSDAQDMIDAANKSGKILMVAQNQRLQAPHAVAKKIISQGLLGKVISFQSTFTHAGPENWLNQKDAWFFNSAASSFGVLGDLGVHRIDLMRYLLEDEIDDFKSYIATLDKKYTNGKPIEVEDNATIILRFKSGVIGNIFVSWCAYGNPNEKTTIYCERGAIEIDCLKDSIQVFNKDNTEVNCTNLMQEAKKNSSIINLFIKSINDGISYISGEDGLKSLQIIEECVR